MLWLVLNKSVDAHTIRPELSFLKDSVPCLSISTRHAARYRETQTVRRVCGQSPAVEKLCQCAREAVANFLSPKGQRD